MPGVVNFLITFLDLSKMQPKISGMSHEVKCSQYGSDTKEFIFSHTRLLVNSPLHVGISLRSALSVTLADESWKSPLIEDKKYNQLDGAT